METTKNDNQVIINEKPIFFRAASELKPFVEHPGTVVYYPNSSTVYFSKRIPKKATPNDVLYKGKILKSHILKSGQISLNARISKTDNLGDAYLAMRNDLEAFFEKLRKSI